VTKLPFTDEELIHSSGHNSWTQFIKDFTSGSLNSDHKPLLEIEEKKLHGQKDAKDALMSYSA